jgi:hypothetical protein
MRAFLSYSSQNADLARRVAEILRVRDVEVWIDQRDLRPGDPLASALTSGISAVDYFVVLVTEASADSNWMRFELGSAIQRAVGGGLRIIPLLFGNGSIPEILAGYKWVRCDDVIDAEKAKRRSTKRSTYAHPWEETARPEIPTRHHASDFA